LYSIGFGFVAGSDPENRDVGSAGALAEETEVGGTSGALGFLETAVGAALTT
jgi:hypothetical protein